MNTFLAGLLSALPLSALGAAAMLIWGTQFVAALKAGGSDFGSMSDSLMQLLFLATFALSPLLLGLLSAAVYNWVKDPLIFRAVALGLAVLLSVLALVSRTPMPVPKIIANFAVALAIGMLLPLLAK